MHDMMQTEVASATTVLNQHRAVAAAAKVAAKVAADKARRERERDVTLRDAHLLEHYQACPAADACLPSLASTMGSLIPDQWS